MLTEKKWDVTFYFLATVRGRVFMAWIPFLIYILALWMLVSMYGHILPDVRESSQQDEQDSRVQKDHGQVSTNLWRSI